MEQVLDKLIRPTIKLLLFTGIEKYLDLIDSCIRTNLSKEKVLETKCAFTTAALTYLFNLRLAEDLTFNEDTIFSPEHLYQIYLIGKTENRYSTSISHTFYLIYGERWINWSHILGCMDLDIKKWISIN